MILIAIGANMAAEDGAAPLQTCRAAVAALGGMPGLRLEGVSRWYRSPAWPPSDQPDYVNGAVLLRGQVEPERLLRRLHEMEAAAGRRRTVANAARPLDLDLLGVGALVVETAALRLPHPRLHERRFVLLPLADVAPWWRHPVLGRSVLALLQGAAEDGTRVMEGQ